MKRPFFVCLLGALVAGSVAAPQSGAQSVTTQDHYRLLPRQSTLHQSGGFAGLDLDYRLTGGYDFARGVSTTSAGAKFVNPEIWGALISDSPTPAYVIDVDELLNLAGLQ